MSDDWKAMLEVFAELDYNYHIHWEGKQAMVIEINRNVEEVNNQDNI